MTVSQHRSVKGTPGMAEEQPLILFLDPMHHTPQYSIPLTKHLRDCGVSIDRGWQSPLHGDAEPPEFEFLRLTFRCRHVLWRMSRSVWRMARGMEYLYDLLRLKRFVRRRGYSIVHYNWLVVPALDLLFMRWLKKQHITVVVTVHNVKPHDSGRISEYLTYAYREADHLITLSNHVKRMLISEAGVLAAKITIVPHGSLDGYMPKVPNVGKNVLPEWFPVNCPIVVCLGDIRPYKGVPDLLYAWAAVVREIPEARLVIAGRLRENCRAEVLSALKGLGGVAPTVFTEFKYLSRDKYQSYLQAATVLGQPYRSASQSGNTVEAFVCGVPVVCTRVGGLPEMIIEGRTGAIAEPGDIGGLAGAIISVLRANAGGELAVYCKQLAEERASWDSITRSILAVYSEQ